MILSTTWPPSTKPQESTAAKNELKNKKETFLYNELPIHRKYSGPEKGYRSKGDCLATLALVPGTKVVLYKVTKSSVLPGVNAKQNKK